MICFYIDTTSNYLYTGLSKDNLLLIERKLNLAHDLSTFALDEVRKMFNEANVDVHDEDKIIVVNGPGSFTGIRIGVTIAKLYAYLLKKDITTISSLEAMNVSNKEDCLHVPIINARRGYVFGAIYNNDEVVLEEQYMTIEKLKLVLMGINKKYVFISNDKFNDLEVVGYDPDILKIINTFKNREPINPHFVNPIYLKLTEAEENRLKDN
jgi:tRNA threonylcarbamoyladenosine biosynthesis protein TsaB